MTKDFQIKLLYAASFSFQHHSICTFHSLYSYQAISAPLMHTATMRGKVQAEWLLKAQV